MSDGRVEAEHRVTPLELFFDLVFVFAFTRVTTFLSRLPTWGGLLRGLLILAVLWWAFTGWMVLRGLALGLRARGDAWLVVGATR